MRPWTRSEGPRSPGSAEAQETGRNETEVLRFGVWRTERGVRTDVGLTPTLPPPGQGPEQWWKDPRLPVLRCGHKAGWWSGAGTEQDVGPPILCKTPGLSICTDGVLSVSLSTCRVPGVLLAEGEADQAGGSGGDRGLPAALASLQPAGRPLVGKGPLPGCPPLWPVLSPRLCPVQVCGFWNTAPKVTGPCPAPHSASLFAIGLRFPGVPFPV